MAVAVLVLVLLVLAMHNHLSLAIAALTWAGSAELLILMSLVLLLLQSQRLMAFEMQMAVEVMLLVLQLAVHVQWMMNWSLQAVERQFAMQWKASKAMLLLVVQVLSIPQVEEGVVSLTLAEFFPRIPDFAWGCGFCRRFICFA